MISDIKMKVDQLSPTVLTEGSMEYPRLTNLGQIFTADWKMRLILAGRAYRMSIGTVGGSGAYTLVGNGTTTDLDIPQAIVAADTGYLIPMSLQWSGIQDSDADNDVLDVLLTADRATAVSAADIATATATAETPDNLLDGADAFVGRACSICTVAITDPVHSDILYFSTQEAIGADGLGPLSFFVDYEFPYPNLIKGPCSLLLYFAGTVGVTGMGSLVFAHVPAAWFPVS